MAKQTTRQARGKGEPLGVLLVNLGTPDSPSVSDVRRYLREFLWDPRVVEVPRPIWWLVLNLVILTTRPRRSAKAYAKVWTEEGSPLLVISKRQQAALQARMEEQGGTPVNVVLAMRYGRPAIASGLQALRDCGAKRVLVLPLYPQYSATTTAAIVDAVADELRHWRELPELRFINDYHRHPAYISALADSVRQYRTLHGEPDKLLLSFHGIPQEYVDAGDPYAEQCYRTADLLVAALDLPKDRWQLSFQSRLGPKQWLQPYTDHTLEALAKEGVRNIHVMCPGFSVDCLETLEEVAMENRSIFLEAGGENYGYIECLNDQASHIQLFTELIAQHTLGWVEG
ncbi:MAG: ferrochelatase [Gammaproteobacteria bacterium]|jgi:ferrochelatase|nr:ferrochelatase [Gammaproteobacteria bacterium]